MNTKHFLYSAVVIVSTTLSALAFDPTPVRISLKSQPTISEKKTTIGLDLGLLSAGTYMVAGVQLAPVAGVHNLYGIQASLFQSIIEGKGYGVQFAGLATFVHCSGEFTFYGVQLAGLANNFSFDRTTIYLAGVQVAGILNLAGDVKGVQIGAMNDSYSMTGLQLGLYNKLSFPLQRHKVLAVQLGVYNTADEINGAQFGISNYAENMTGFQLGLVNRAIKLKGLQLGLINILSKIESPTYRVIPILNVAWDISRR